MDTGNASIGRDVIIQPSPIGEPMDWIEKLFGISPDGGDGSTEVLVVLAVSIVLAGVILWRVPFLRTAARRLLQRPPAGP